MVKDLFSGHAGEYAAFRPTYPEALYQFIFKRCTHFDKAWDCGTGNGQVAQQLAQTFKEVTATDISRSQLQHAVQAKNISYVIAPAEDVPFAVDSFDLITAGQAIHWFDLELFYKECLRVGKNNAVVAFFGYSPVRGDTFLNEIIDEFYFNTIYSYWEAERKIVEDRYASLYFPFEEIPSPSFRITVEWSAIDLEGYLNTWSSVKKYIREKGVNPVDELMDQIKTCWKEPRQSLYFPVFLKLGRIHK